MPSVLMMENNTPVVNVFRNGISLAGWKSDKGFSFKINKRYQDKEGAWKDSSYFYENDLADLKELINKVLVKIAIEEARS